MLNKSLAWLKKEKVLIIAGICALFTMFYIHPDKEYISYIDFRVLCLLLCLMAVIEGFKRCGTFEWMSTKLIKGTKSGRALGSGLILLPFFSSMLVTNDVSLITFIPFTIMLLNEIKCTKNLILILVLQTIAANLGSMATPVGNPQNLFLYANYEIGAREFFSVMLPLTICSLVFLIIASIYLLPKNLPETGKTSDVKPTNKIYIFAILFILCLLTVFRVLPYWLLTPLVVLTILFTDKKIFRNLDYGLLITFVFFFIVSENLGRIDTVKNALNCFLEKDTLLTAVAASQIISNVPAAVLLSGFTNDCPALLQGVNIGGLGTPIASLASIITLKLYMQQKKCKNRKIPFNIYGSKYYRLNYTFKFYLDFLTLTIT